MNALWRWLESQGELSQWVIVAIAGCLLGLLIGIMSAAFGFVAR